jgi:hypothetical protein
MIRTGSFAEGVIREDRMHRVAFADLGTRAFAARDKLALVLHAPAPPMPTRWALLDTADLADAREMLRARGSVRAPHSHRHPHAVAISKRGWDGRRRTSRSLPEESPCTVWRGPWPTTSSST